MEFYFHSSFGKKRIFYGKRGIFCVKGYLINKIITILFPHPYTFLPELLLQYPESTDNLHFDHILPFSKGGGTSLKVENIQLLCAKHNLEKRDKII